ncbi:MAG: Xaa-Pro peptidase family protein [Planctomycetota bacterium]
MAIARLAFAASEHNSDMYYLSGFLAPDPFAWFKIRGRTGVVLSPLELDRGRRTARVHHVFSNLALRAEFKSVSFRKPSHAALLAFLFKRRGVRSVEVPRSFPLGLAEDLRREGLRVAPVKGAFVPERARKTPEEVRAIADAIRRTEKVLGMVIRRLARTRIRKGRLWEGGRVLTSEAVKAGIAEAFLRAGMRVVEDTIVACGDDACEPHNRGAGPLRADTAIILDIFPRSETTRYHADITRTVVRGTASPELKRMYAAVAAAQRAALRKIRAGRNGADANTAACDCFKAWGFETGEENGRQQGFIHSTGHGLGLDVHDGGPGLFPGAGRLPAGAVVTVEPGLYYPGVGAVRLEDDVVVTKTGCRVLSRFPKVLEI